jgi:hypothetical protein
MKKCHNSIIINSPIDNVWNLINDFHDLSWGDKVVTKVDKIGEKPGNEIGAKRIINEAFHETLLSLNESEYTFSYSIDDGPAPVSKETISNYVGVVKLYPITLSNQTFIEWTSTYDSANPEDVADFCNPIYVGLLKSLESKF